MQTMTIDGFERKSLETVKYDIADRMAVFNKSFRTSVKPEHGVYGITEIIKDNGATERLSINELGFKRKDYYQDGILTKRREKISNSAWCTTQFDDKGTAYLTQITNKATDGKLTAGDLNLKPGIEIKKGNLTVKVDNYGRPVSNKVTDLKICPGREYLSSKLRDSSYREGDQRGHIIADIFGGSAKKENIVPQMSETNMKQMKELENCVRKLKEEGHSVDYEIKTNYTGKDHRPTSFEPTITVDGKAYTELPPELKKIYNDNLSKAGKAMTTVKEHVSSASAKVSPFHEAGVKEGLDAAMITCAVSTIDNVVKFSEGDITAEEMVIDIAKDTGTAGVVGYATGFVTKAVAVSMQSSTNTMLQSLGKCGVPAAVVSFGVASYENVMDFAQGEIDGLELAYDLGENAASVAGGAAGAALAGAAVGSVVPGAGTAVGFVVGGGVSLVGGMVGTAVATGVYQTAVAAGAAGTEVLAKKAHEVASGTVEAAREYVPEHVEDVRNALNSFLSANDMPFKV